MYHERENLGYSAVLTGFKETEQDRFGILFERYVFNTPFSLS